MALVNSSFTVNVTPGAMPPIVHVSEYDVGRTYTVTINGENGSVFNIPTGTTATVEGTLNGAIGFTTDATISGSTVSFTLTESMTAKSGRAWCKIKLTLNNEPIQTCAFVLAVDRAGVEADTVIGADGFEQQIVDAVQDWLDEHPPAFDGMSEAFKQALLDCFENVAWINDDGQTYYDALYAALYAETPVPERVTWSYNPASGKLLSEFTPYIVSGTATGNATESLVDGLLKLVSISTSSDGANFSYTFATTTNQHAKLYARVKFTSVPYNEAGNGFRLQVSNGTAGAVIYTRRTSQSGTTCKFGTYVGNVYTDIADLVLGQWYEISVELSSSQQIITINGNSVFTGGLSTYYISQHRIMAQCGQNGGSIEADVSSVKFYDYD